MPPSSKSRSPLQALLLALMIVPPVSVLAAAPWLKQQPDGTALMLTGLAATLTIIASFALAMLQDRQIDEWQRSNARFSVQWGWATGSALVALLLALPPIHDLILSGAAVWGGEPNPDQQLVLLTFTFGFLAVVVAQALCTALLSFGWHVWMSRAPREPS